MSKQIIPEALAWLNVAGVNITDEKIHIRGIILTILSLLVVVLEIMQIAFYFDDIDTVAGVVEVLASVYLSLIKILMVVNHHETLSRITKNMNDFWSTNKFNEKLEDELESIFITVKTMLFSYRWLAIMTTTLIITLKPVFIGTGELPVDIWQPINLLISPYYEITYFIESCVGYFASFVNIAIDSLYVGYIIHIIAQFTLLKYAFSNIPMKQAKSYEDETICLSEMKQYIEYHNHLLNKEKSKWTRNTTTVQYLLCTNTINPSLKEIILVINGLNEINALLSTKNTNKNVILLESELNVIDDIQNSHSFTFLNVFLTGTIYICIDLYSAASDFESIDIMRLIKYTFQCSFFVFLLFAYCFTGNQLTYQCLSVSDAMYDSEWYYGPLPRLRRGVILVIQKTQKDIKLNAGGLLTLDLENFIKMLRLAFSVFTLIRAQAEKENQ